MDDKANKVDIKKCEVEWCDRTSHSHPHRFGHHKDTNMILCHRHRQQFLKHGKFLERTVFDRNQIIENENYAEMLLYDGKNNKIGRTKIDLESAKLVSVHKWHLGKNGYVTSRIEGKLILLHRFLLNPKSREVVDHINRDRLDNRMHNLRVVSNSLNGFNKGRQSNNTSGYVGIRWISKENKWWSRIMVNQKTYHLGYFDDIADAVKAREDAEIKYFGELRNSHYDKNTFFKTN